MILYIKGKEHDKLLVDSVLYVPFKYGTVTELGTLTTPATIRDRRYDEFTNEEKIREACDIKATNIVLQGLLQDIYNLLNHHIANHSSLDHHHQSYQALSIHQPPQASFLPMDSGLAVPSFLPSDDQIGKEHDKLLVDSVLYVPFIYGIVTELGTLTTPATIRDRRYDEFTNEEKIREACDIKATNIVLQGLLQDIYNLLNHHSEAKDIWDRVKLLIEGSEISLQNRESKLYDEFGMFTS
nr:hypothetical protein [Tanacetum cinerariifolium]